MVVHSGKCGDNVFYSLNTDTGIMEITGYGDMYGYLNRNAPWYDYNLLITKVIIYSSITSVGDASFRRCSNLIEVRLPDSITYIGAESFYATGLTSITIPKNVTLISSWAFMMCINVKRIEFYGPETSIYHRAFALGYNEFPVTADVYSKDHWATSQTCPSDSIHTTLNYHALIENAVRVKVNGSWKQAKPYVKVDGSWKLANPYTKVNGVWKKSV